MTDPTTTRRSVLRRAIGLAAGAVGVGALAGTADATATPIRITSRLTARQVETRETGERRYAVLLDGRGETVGHLHGALLPLASPFGLGGAPTAFELHTISLPGGTLFAQGAFHGSIGTFYVTGGAGRFAGVHGSYRYELGRGVPELALDITIGEDS
jgi:hypothetical protein